MVILILVVTARIKHLNHRLPPSNPDPDKDNDNDLKGPMVQLD